MMPKLEKPDPPPSTPTRADASVMFAGFQAAKTRGLADLINTSGRGATSAPRTAKRTLIGGTPS
jgi:hypothetical protein